MTIFGDSNLMLRLPGMLFVLAAGALAWWQRPRDLTAAGAAIWAGLIVLWPETLALMLDARGYALLLLLSVASTLAFARLLDTLSWQRAATWVGLGTLMFLTHYYAATLLLAQAMLVVWRYRLALLRVWPAALVALPGLAWFAIHAARLRDYARADVVWQQATTLDAAAGHVMFLLGAGNPLLFAIMAGAVLLAFVHRDRHSAAMPQPLVLVVATAVLGLVIACAIGAFQASLVSRYLVPLIPPALLGLAVVLQRSARPLLYGAIVLAVLLVPALSSNQIAAAAALRAVYGFEQGSDFVAKRKADQVVFLWDHPAGKILDRASLEQLGATFLRRNGLTTSVSAVVVPATSDANAVLRAAASGSRPAVIWVYNRAERTAARTYRPTFADDPAWSCHASGAGALAGAGASGQQLGALACIKQAASSGS